MLDLIFIYFIPQGIKKVIKEFITNELLNFCKDKKYIDDYMGSGPEKIK